MESLKPTMNLLNRRYRYLLLGALTTIWVAGLSGFSVQNSPALFLIVHFISSAAVVTLTMLFLSRHWLHRYDKLGQHPNSRQGYIALVCISLLAVSGLALLKWTNVSAIRWLHA